jgi:Ca2+/H+ antiporter
VIELMASGGSGHDRREGSAVNSVLALLLGLGALVVGAEMVVREGSALAARFNVSPIVVGMTIVSLGTSLPELAIGLNAAQQGNAGLAVGNIVGTNLVNILLILGLIFGVPILTTIGWILIIIGLVLQPTHSVRHIAELPLVDKADIGLEEALADARQPVRARQRQGGRRGIAELRSRCDADGVGRL